MVGLIFALIALGAVAPEPPHHREHVDVQAVMVDVHVTDRFGDFVSGLGAGDFEVYEDGAPQVIESVREVHHAVARVAGLPERAEQPATEPESEPLTRAETTSQPPAAPLPPRHFVFLLDLHNGVGNRGRDAVVRWAREHLRPEDRVTIATYLWNLRILVDDQPFSEEMVRYLERGSRAQRVEGFDPSLLLATATDEGLDVGALRAIGAAERSMGSRRMLDAMKQLALRLEGRTGHKTVLLLSDGLRMDKYSKHRAYRRIREEIGPQFEAAEASIFAIQTTGLNGFARGLGGNDLMYYFAYRTGGRHLYNTWNFDDFLQEVANEVDSYYQLSYTSRAQRNPGDFRTINVVVRGKDLRVRHKRGYYVRKDFAEMDKGERSAALVAALESPHRTANLPAGARLIPVPRGDDRVWLGVAVTMPREAIVPGADGRARLEMLAEVRNELGAPVASLDHVLSLEPGPELEAAREHGLEWLGGLLLTRGKGSLHAVLRDEASGRTSSWELPFDLRDPAPAVLLVETEQGRLRVGDQKSWPHSLLEFQGRTLHPRLERPIVTSEKIGLLVELPASEEALAKGLSLLMVAPDGSRHELEPLGTAKQVRTHRVSILSVVEVPEVPAGPCLLGLRLHGEGADRVAELPLWCR